MPTCTGADLTGANLTDAEVRGADFRTDFTMAIPVRLAAALLDGQLPGPRFDRNQPGRQQPGRREPCRPEPHQCGFDFATLTNANLSQANSDGRQLLTATAPPDGVDFSQANATNADFGNATLTSANLSQANLTSANFDGATLTNANLSGPPDRGQVACQLQRRG